MKANIIKERSTTRVISTGQMAAITKESSTTTIYKATVHTHGLMEESTLANGKTTKCMDLAYSPGVTVESTRVITRTTRNMETESSLGQMEGNMTETGKMENKMAKEL